MLVSSRMLLVSLLIGPLTPTPVVKRVSLSLTVSFSLFIVHWFIQYYIRASVLWKGMLTFELVLLSFELVFAIKNKVLFLSLHSLPSKWLIHLSAIDQNQTKANKFLHHGAKYDQTKEIGTSSIQKQTSASGT